MRLNPADIPAAHEIIRDNFLETIAPDYTEEGVSVFMEFIDPENISKRIKQGNEFFCHRPEDVLLGVSELREGNHIALLFVWNGARGTGIGRALMDELIERVGENKFDFITVNSAPGSEKFYAKMGFERTEGLQERSGIKYIPMKKRIGSGSHGPALPFLIEPTVELEREHADMLRDWRSTGEAVVPFVLGHDSTDFPKYVERLLGFKQGVGVPEFFVPHSTFWLVDAAGRILGVVNIRHRLTDNLLRTGGNIGFGIRPSERKKGNATAILGLALVEAKKLGLDRVLLTCDKDNVGSASTILRNGGIFFRDSVVDGKAELGFWIGT